MRINYSGDKRRRELALKQKKEEKAARLAERRALKGSQPVDPDAHPAEGDISEAETPSDPDSVSPESR